jgi:para-aminobenzoate synthetase component I
MNPDGFEEIIADLPQRLTRVHSAGIRLREPFVETVRRFARLPGTVSLMSGGTSDCSRYHLLGIEPWLTLRAQSSNVAFAWGKQSVSVEGPPLDILRKVLRHFSLPQSQNDLPLSAGFLGYLSYDLKDCLEELPRTSIDDLKLPYFFLVAPSVLLIQDKLTNSTHALFPVFGEDEDQVERRIRGFNNSLEQPSASVVGLGSVRKSFRSCFARQEYLRAVESIHDYIVRGHVYQVNMSQRFETSYEGDPFALYETLYARNPAPFFAYINAGDHQVISTSPERFLRLSDRTVETRPIKGTRPRGATPDEDARMKHDLETSPKDDAELSMIVDLMRNDIGKVCRAGSVHVARHKRLESYTNVHHLVSVVKGTLDDEKDAVDLICATFPGGSITGCPKIRAMEIIDELEPVRRHIYTGSIGYISFHGTMDLSIAIRTATITSGRLLFSVGGGVVYDSDPDDEFDETLHKGQTLMNAFAIEELSPAPIAWCNGLFKPRDEITVSVDDEGFLYGFGFFETIRVNKGNPVMFDRHLARFNRSWEEFFGLPAPDVTWEEVVGQIIVKNGLSDKIAAIKILAAAGKPGAKDPCGTLLVTAKEYVHRLDALARSALRLAVYPHRRHSCLADHKTMNYMFYTRAGIWAKSRMADEAIILNADGTVSETNTANLFCEVRGKICRPVSEHALPGTMEQAVCELLETWERPVESRMLSVDDLMNAQHVFLTNSLMGAVPVSHIGERQMGSDDGLCRKINQALLATVAELHTVNPPEYL